MLSTASTKVVFPSPSSSVSSRLLLTILSDPSLESSWILQPFQSSNPTTNKVSEHNTFLQHIHTGFSLLSEASNFLIFSGGRTNPSIPYSEAKSYSSALKTTLPSQPIPFSREIKRWSTEDESTDSFQNILFSICRFRTLVGCYPDSITLITHEFKETRFMVSSPLDFDHVG